MTWCLILVSLSLALIPVASVNARQATPLASPVAIDPGDCTTEPRSNDEMRALIESGLPPIASFIAGTPIGSATPLSPANEGEPASEATVAAVTETAFQFVSCSNAGNLPAVATLLTEQGAASYLSLGFLQFRDMFAGTMGTPTAEIDLDLVNNFLATMQFHAPLPEDFRLTLYDIESVSELNDGSVRAIVLLATGEKEPRRTSMMLQKEDGRWRVVFGRNTGIGSSA